MPRVDSRTLELFNDIRTDRRVIANLSRLGPEREWVVDHSSKVALCSVMLGYVNDVDLNDLYCLGTGGMLHDVGKYRVDTRILDKGSALTHEEREMIKKHPEWGVEALQGYGFDERILYIVRNVHTFERNDPYPEKKMIIEGPERLAEFVAVADCHEALTGHRHYNQCIEQLSKDDIRGIMERELDVEKTYIDQVIRINDSPDFMHQIKSLLH